MGNKSIPFSPPDIGEEEIEEVVNALRSGWITTGVRTKKFERMVADYCGTSKAVALNSATAALELTLRILGVGPGDEVITTAYTYTASASVVEHVGAKLVLVDTAPDSFELDYDSIGKAITERTKVIIPVDIGGRMCDYNRILSVVEQKKSLFQANNSVQERYDRVIVMADGAHSFGAKRMENGKEYRSGQMADFTVFSFHAVKNLTTAEGGAVVWRDKGGLDNEWLYKQYMLYSLHGQNKDAFEKNQVGAWEYDIVYPGYKCNMTDVLAAIGIKQLERYGSILERRREIIQKYDAAFSLPNIRKLIHYDENSISSGHLYLLRIMGITEEKRNQIIIKMAENGITTNVHYKPLPMMTAYRNLGFSIEDYPNAYKQYCNEITLPLHTCLSDEDVEYIINCLLDCIR